MTIIERIEQLDDFKALRFYEHVSTKLFAATDADAETMMQHLPPDIAATPEMQEVKRADESAFDKPVDNKEAVAFARESLSMLAGNPSTAELITDELDNWKDDSMIAGTILAIGGAISLIMLLATSEITYDRKHGLKIGIGSVKETEFVHARIEMIKTLFNIIPSLRSLLGRKE